MKYALKFLKGLFIAAVGALTALTWAIPMMATAQYTPAVAWRISSGALIPANAAWTIGKAILPIVNGYFTDLTVVTLNGSTPCVSSGTGCPSLSVLGTDEAAVTNGTPYYLAADDNGYVWVTNNSQASISKVDAATGVSTSTVTVGTSPEDILFANDYIWVSNNGSNRISKVSVTSSSVLANIPTAVAPYDLEWDGTYVWVAQGGGTGATVAKISVTSTRVVATSTVATSPRELHYALGKMWVGNFTSKSIKVVSTSTNAVLATIPLSYAPYSITDDGTNIYVGTLSAMNVIDGTTYAVTTSTGPWSAPNDAVYSGGYVWFTNSGNDTILKVNTTTHDIIKIIGNKGDAPYGIERIGNYLWVVFITSKNINRLLFSNY